MKSIIINITRLFFLGILAVSCNKVLDIPPKGVVNEDELNTPENAEKLVIAAYSALGNDHWEVPYSSGWVYGSVRSDDSYKGGLGTADQGEFTQYEIFSTVRVDQSRGNLLWTKLYQGVQRANLAMKVLNNINTDALPTKNQRYAEARFIRGHFYFLLKEHFKNIPIFDENTAGDSLNQISNVQYSNVDSWSKIAEDFQFAADNLPLTQEQKGRPNKYTAESYLAKVRLYEAYEQDDQNNVININKDKLNQVIELVDDVINSHNYALSDDYAENYLWSSENGKESIFAVQDQLMMVRMLAELTYLRR